MQKMYYKFLYAYWVGYTPKQQIYYFNADNDKQVFNYVTKNILKNQICGYYITEINRYSIPKNSKIITLED